MLIFLILLSILDCYFALQCTTNCSFTANLRTPFSIPDSCQELIEGGKCRGEIIFWYNWDKYDVRFVADLSNSIDVEDNKRYVLLDWSWYVSGYFSYSINRACNDQDDCARHLITDIANEMSQRNYNYSSIKAEIQPLISDPIFTPKDPELQCYDPKHNVQRCGTSSSNSSCVIINKIQSKRMSFQCDTKLFGGDVHVSIYQELDSDYASFNIHCNGSLCNTRSTLRAVKQMAYKHGITVTLDGRLDGSRLVKSTLLIMAMIFFLYFH